MAASRHARLEPIEGHVVDVQITEGREQHQGSLLYVSTKTIYEVTPPGASHPARTVLDVHGKCPISRHGEVPAEVPRVGDPHPLWYDPEDPTFATFYSPDSAGPERRHRRVDPDRARRRGRARRRPAGRSCPAPTSSSSLGRGHCGSVMVTLTPPPSRFASATRPPCASAISRTKASPRPVPPRFVE